jgi:hypothetical protein
VRAFERGVLRTIFEPKTERWQETEEDYLMRVFIIFTVHQMLLE